MFKPVESTLVVPAELTRRIKGLALDFGCSRLKCVYRSREDFDEVADEAKTVGRLHLVSFGRDELQQGLDYIRQRAYLLTDGDQPPTINTTGVGCTEFGQTIRDTLNVRLQNATEFDCCGKAFVYLAARLGRDQLLEPFLDSATAEPLAYIHGMMAAMQAVKGMSAAVDVDAAQMMLQGLSMAVGRSMPSPAADVPGDAPLTVAEPDAFPCVIATCGSGACFMKIEKDGSFKIVDSSSRGGKALLGVGALLTGCKSFEELIELASHGDARNVDQYSDELFDASAAADGADDMYKQTAKLPPSLMFCFGKAAAFNANLDGLKREDKARSWLQYVLVDLVQCAHHVCLISGVKRLFLCGGFCSHPLIRQIMTTELARRNLAQMMFAQVEPIVFDFVKPGMHLGALGCIVSDIDK